MKNGVKIFILGAIFILTACSKSNEKEPEQSYNSIADEADSEIKLPEGAKIIENPKDFKPVALDQSYNMETDSSLSLGSGITTDGKNVYFHYFHKLNVLDIETKSFVNLCSKPQCTHSSNDCAAYFNSMGIQYFQGFLYTVMDEDLLRGNNEGVYDIALYKISLDGNTKEKICTLATIYKGDMVTAAGSDMMSGSVYWMIHRGYIYYVYNIGTSGLKDNTFYNNMSHYICRMKIGKNEEREYIMPLARGSRAAEIDFWGYGSYMYFSDIEDETGKGELYRFNVESKEVEKLPFGKRMVGTYTAWQDFLLFTNVDADSSDTNLYKYDKDGSIEKIADFADYDKRFGTLSSIFLFRDSEYVYATSWVDKEENITRCIVLDYEGNYISSFDCIVEGNITVGLRSINDKLMLMPTTRFKWYYFDKEELRTGEIHPVKLEDSEIEEW